jgi:hypothetical protein
MVAAFFVSDAGNVEEIGVSGMSARSKSAVRTPAGCDKIWVQHFV